MPKATVSHDHIKHDLKTLEDGWVKLRKLTYEEVLTRRDGATRLVMEAEQAATTNGDAQAAKMELETLQLWSRKFEFRNCIVEHNLEDENGQLLDFNNPMTYKMLDTRIALELERLIDKVNGEDDEEALRDFTVAASNLSEVGMNTPLNDSVES